MQETEQLPSSKNATFPGSIPWAPGLDRSQNISSFRIQGHCIFILFPQWLQEVKRELQLFLRSWLCVLSGPGLMFRLTVTSPALRRVTDAEDTQLATGQWRCEADLQFVFAFWSSCVFGPIILVHSHVHIHIYELLSCSTSGRYFLPVERSTKGPAMSVLIRHQHVSGIPRPLPWGFCPSEWTSIFIYRALPFPLSLCSAKSQHL